MVHRPERRTLRGLRSEQSPCLTLDRGDRATDCERGTAWIERGSAWIERGISRARARIQRRTQRPY